MADANVTFTVDTASSPWVLSDGTVTTINSTAETFVLRLIDLGTTSNLEGGGALTTSNVVTLGNGSTITIGKDRKFIHLGTFTDTVAKLNPGSLWVEEDGVAHEVKVTTATLTDADAVGANNLAAITFEYPGKPYQWSWTNINTA